MYKNMQKMVIFLLATVLAALCFSGCGETANGAGVEIVTTVFPIYDWVREIAAGVDGVEITLLLDSGADLHSYRPTVDDIVKISTCDLFICVGGESDGWVEGALRDGKNADRAEMFLLEVLGDRAKEEEHVEGMEEHGEGEEEEEEGPEYDEHIWLSLKNAAVLCEEISKTLGALDPDNADKYAANAAAYAAKLGALDAEYEKAVSEAKVKTLVFADRFPFRYLVEDYGLSYYAAFSGCSAESEASFETILFLAGKVDELGLSAIMQIESADGSIARTVKENTSLKDQTVLTLDSLQSVTAKDVESGAMYISVMENNLEVLKQALR